MKTTRRNNMKANMTLPDAAKAKEYFQNKISFTIGPMELDHLIKENENINIIDVRAQEDYEKGHIPGALNLPRERWQSLEGLSKDKPNILYCYTMVCHLAATAAVEFAGKGFPVKELEGGFDGWKEDNLEIETRANRRVSLKV